MSLSLAAQRGYVSHLVDIIGTNAGIVLLLLWYMLCGKRGSHFVHFEAAEYINSRDFSVA